MEQIVLAKHLLFKTTRLLINRIHHKSSMLQWSACKWHKTCKKKMSLIYIHYSRHVKIQKLILGAFSSPCSIIKMPFNIKQGLFGVLLREYWIKCRTSHWHSRHLTDECTTAFTDHLNTVLNFAVWREPCRH